MKKLLCMIFLFAVLKMNAQVLLKPIVDSIPMRDEKYLAADIYLPDTSQNYPVILIQTPYNRLFYRTGLPLKVGKNLKDSPYAFVIVDWRCFYGSADACILNPERGKDGYDIIDWIVKQSWSNGKVGTWGPSALGKIQYMTAKEQHPNHTCAVPVVAGSQFEYKEYFPNGVFRTEYVDQLDALGYNMKNTLLQHPYYDIYWQYIETANMYPDKIKIPMFLIGGWFDHNIEQMFRLFDTLLKASDPSVRELHKFLVGPWSHNTVGKKKVGDLEFPEAEGACDSFALLFLDYWLREAKNGWPTHSKYLLYEMKFGAHSSSCELTATDTWEMNASYKNSFFLINNSLIQNPTYIPAGYNDSFTFEYNPKNPSPSIGGATLRTDLDQGPLNIGALFNRNDHYRAGDSTRKTGIVYMYIAGSPEVELYVSSDRFDTDIAIRFGFIDPDDGDTIILSDGIYRMRFLKGFSIADTQLITPGKIYPVRIKLPPISCYLYWQSYPFIMITSSNYPRYDMNLNNGGVLYTGGDSLTAHNTVYIGETYPSSLFFSGYVHYAGMEENKNDLVSVYPNPVKTQLFIKANDFDAPFNYTLTDLSGRVLFQGEKRENTVFSIDVSGLEPQVYLLRISNEKQSRITKVVKVE